MDINGVGLVNPYYRPLFYCQLQVLENIDGWNMVNVVILLHIH